MQVRRAHSSMLVLCAMLACGDEPNGRGGGGNAAGKADDASDGYDPSLSAHRNAVGACIASASESREYREAEEVEEELRACIADANDEVWEVVQNELPDEIWDRRARDHRRPRVDETVKLVEVLRIAQERVCEVLAAASTYDEDDDEDATALANARCLSVAELHTANLIDAHVDFGSKLAEIVPPWKRYDWCVELFEEQAPHGLRDAYFGLRDCAKEIDAELRVPWAKMLVASDEDKDLELSEALIDVSGAFEHESRVGWDLCLLFSHASPAGTENDVAEAQCVASSAIQMGSLIEALTLASEEDDDEDDDRPEPEPDPDPDPDDDDPDPMPQPADGEVCYPGPAGDFSVCLPLSYPSPTPEGYSYQPALGGDPNYRKPIAYLDLEAIDPNTQLTVDFALGEIAQLHKGRWAIVQPHAVASLQQLREDVGAISVASGYRSPAYNVSVGGAQYSRHMYGDGFDLDPNEVGLDDLEHACQHRGGFLVEYTSHVHCDFRLDAVDEGFFGAS